MEDKLIDADVLTELKGRMKENRVMPDLIGDFTVEDLRNIDPKTYETCLGPVAVSSSITSNSLVDKESFKNFMDALIIYVEDPTPDKAIWVKTLQRMYNIGVFITDYPLSARVSITVQCGMWNVYQWDEMIPYDTAEIIKKAVDYL